MDRVKFALPGYQRCIGPFIREVNKAVAASNPLLGQIAERPSHHRGPIRNAPHPNPVEHKQEPVSMTIAVPFDVIRDGDVERFVGLLIQSADEQYIHQLETQLISVVHDTTEATGAVIDAKGKSLTFDHIIDLIETMDLRNDEDGKLRMPTILMNPETRKILNRIPPTQQQLERLNAVAKSKYDENVQRKKTRRLG